jgi:hypothetical protein
MGGKAPALHCDSWRQMCWSEFDYVDRCKWRLGSAVRPSTTHVVIAPDRAIDKRKPILHGKIQSCQRIRRPIEQPRRKTVVLRDREPFPFTRWLDCNVRASAPLKVVEDALFMTSTCPLAGGPVLHKAWAIYFRLQCPVVLALPTEEPPDLGAVGPLSEDHSEIKVNAEHGSEFFGCW